MNTMRNIDEKLMRLLTYNLWYHDLDNRPQTRIAIMVTVAAILLTFSQTLLVWINLIPYIALIATVLCLFTWLVTFYEWRLWYRLRKRKIKHEE